ncbi:hypothetical protein OUZ56_016820 [Daphnia magna]|uniref:Uncharacterized protein n=1 Tax=Daphnia magna TaxID=35525 RepID=A0ABR0ARM7_9CRUS|nr:hypothetical protein OUZ56_016820 [Daphnia magna]
MEEITVRAVMQPVRSQSHHTQAPERVQKKYPETVRQLQQQLYVDDWFKGGTTVEEAEKRIREAFRFSAYVFPLPRILTVVQWLAGKYRRWNYKKGEWVFDGVERGTNRCFLFIPILTLSRNHLFTCFALSMMKRMLSAQEDSDTCVAFMKIANACVADGNVLPGNYGNWIPQPEQDSAISTTFEEDPEDSDGNDEPIEDETGADITDLDSDDNDDDQPSSGPPSSLTINPPSPLLNSTSQRPTTLLLNPPTPNAKEEFPLAITKKSRNFLKMLHYTHLEALGRFYLLPLSSPPSSRSCRGREDLPPIFNFPQLRNIFNNFNFSKT